MSENSEETENVASETPQVNARLVVITIDDDGGSNVNPIGVDILSVPTLLRVVAKNVETNLGI